MTESFDGSSRKRYQALGNSQDMVHLFEKVCRQLAVPNIIGRKKSKDSQEKWLVNLEGQQPAGRKAHACVDATRKVKKNSISILTAKRGI